MNAGVGMTSSLSQLIERPREVATVGVTAGFMAPRGQGVAGAHHEHPETWLEVENPFQGHQHLLGDAVQAHGVKAVGRQQQRGRHGPGGPERPCPLDPVVARGDMAQRVGQARGGFTAQGAQDAVQVGDDFLHLVVVT